MARTETSPLVERTHSRLKEALAKGRFRSHQPLPTHRQWAKKLGVSQFIVSRAMELLKKDGVVESSEGSYTFLRALPSAHLLKRQQARRQAPVRISLWANDRKDFWKMRLAILRQRFQSQFRTQHPGVEFDVHQIDRRASEVEMLLVQSIMSGPEPTLGHSTQTCLPFLVQHNAIAAVTGHDEYVQRLKSVYRKACTVDGRLHLVPTNVTHTMMLYSKEMFRKAGLDPNRPPRDWQELTDFAEKISHSDGGRPSFHVGGTTNFVAWLMQLACQSMPRFSEERAPVVNWTTESAAGALRYFVELHVTRKVINLHERDMATFIPRCLAGEFAMVVGEWGSITQIALMKQTDRFGIAPLPLGPNGQPLSLMNCGGWFVNAHATPEQQAATWEYAVALERWQHLGVGAGFMKGYGVAPSLVSIFENRTDDRFVADNLPADWVEVLESLEAHSRWEPIEADWKKAALGRAAEDLLAEEGALSAERMMHAFSLRETEAGFGQSIPSLTEENQTTKQ